MRQLLKTRGIFIKKSGLLLKKSFEIEKAKLKRFTSITPVILMKQKSILNKEKKEKKEKKLNPYPSDSVFLLIQY